LNPRIAVCLFADVPLRLYWPPELIYERSRNWPDIGGCSQFITSATTPLTRPVTRRCFARWIDSSSIFNSVFLLISPIARSKALCLKFPSRNPIALGWNQNSGSADSCRLSSRCESPSATREKIGSAAPGDGLASLICWQRDGCGARSPVHALYHFGGN
jgi:hypothetical protein